MQSPDLKQSNPNLAPTETVRFFFPRSPELALYALGTLQSFVEMYGKSLERARMWDSSPEARRTLIVEVHCEQRFYLTLRKSFPACAVWIPNGIPSTPRSMDEMCVVLSEHVLAQFELLPTYSTQWLMGQLAGTLPRLVPTIEPLTELTADYVLVDRTLGVSVSDSDLPVIVSALERGPDALEATWRALAPASMVVAQQGLLTVLAVAIGKPVVEITQTASKRSFLGIRNYVQVSRLSSDVFFQKSLERGIEWLREKTTVPSVVLNADAPSPQ
jgi:hypothetical protein